MSAQAKSAPAAAFLAAAQLGWRVSGRPSGARVAVHRPRAVLA
jgi:hypothetical protein